MAKMTAARVERWNKDLTKALSLIQRVHDDLGDAKLNTSGGNYSDVIDIGGSLVPAIRNLTSLTSDGLADSAIARIKARVAEAAEQRKRAKAEREAAKAAAPS